MKNVFTFEIEFLKNHQITKGKCYVCVEADGALNSDKVLSRIKETILNTYNDFSHLRIYRYGEQLVDYNGKTIEQAENTIKIVVYKGYEIDEVFIRNIEEE